MTSTRVLRSALLPLSVVAAVACGDGAVSPDPGADACAQPAVPLPLSDTVQGVLDDTDCLTEEGRLIDRYEIVLPEATLFLVSLRTSGFFPHTPFYLDTTQVAGWGSDRFELLEREHLFPAGTYVVQATSFNIGTDRATAPRGAYTLFTRLLQVPQEGCGRETTVTYGSRVAARITLDDCEAAQEREPGVDRRLDGYTFLMDGRRQVTVTATADFPYRLTHWSNGQPILQIPAIPAGESREVTVDAFGFQDFYVVNEEDAGVGSYTLVFSEPPPG